jgi:hypothetical protein
MPTLNTTTWIAIALLCGSLVSDAPDARGAAWKRGLVARLGRRFLRSFLQQGRQEVARPRRAA